ncbi:MAG TPA: TetR/AcrR family transcriptional regulator [Kofleriaceae bacterium]|nr:TetR/AcrR family transcriptional regulator [Kofleriaceae bacterium]
MGKLAKPDRSRQTRAVLVETALKVFNDVGYWGTDSNALAREAGYSPGTFYRHFVDKRAIFIAAYQAWSAAEEELLRARMLRAKEKELDRAGTFVDFLIEHHGRWRTFRSSTRALAAGDGELQRAVREHRRRHLAVLGDLLGRREIARGLVVLYTLDGLSDALANGEPKHLGVSAREVTDRVRGMVGNGAASALRRG